MAPPSKPASQRQRRNRTSTAAEMEAPAVTQIALPTRYSAWKCVSCYLAPNRHTEEHFDKEEIHPHDFAPAAVEWQALTLAWWNTIWASPMVEEWVDADVPGLVALAMLWDTFYLLGDSKIHGEARMASREFGLSPLSRRQLQWEIKRLEATPAPKPAAAPRSSSRSRLGVLQGGKAAG